MASDQWNSDFLDLIDTFAGEGGEYVVVGAFALAQHGLPRATGAINFLIRPSEKNALRVYRALTRFGAMLSAASVTPADFTQPGTVYQIVVVPRRIDILTQLSGVTFDEAWASRIERVVDDRAVPFIGLQALLKNKRATGRAKDAVDADALERLHRTLPG